MAIPLKDRDPCRFDLATRVYRSLTEGLDPIPEDLTVDSIARYLEKPPDSKLGDYALPCFRFSKALKKKPPEIALELSKRLASASERGWLEKAVAVGAFLNLFTEKRKLSQVIIPAVRSGSYFKVLREDPENQRERVMVEFSQPNTHKVFHVGHMRNVALGDSICRIFRFCGFPVVPVNYIGDEGAHIAKCLRYLTKNQLEAPDDDRGEWLGDQYTKATLELEDLSPDQKRTAEKEISVTLRALESRQGAVYELWKTTKMWSMQSFLEIYEWLDVKFDHYFYESDLTEASHALVKEYQSKGLFIESMGAIGIDLEGHRLPFLMLRKTDGSVLYATRDLALAKKKFVDYQIDRSVYVVASEQNLHFQQVFKTLELMGFSAAKKCQHVSYGMVVLPEGKMSSRAGNVITFRALKESMKAELAAHMETYRSEFTAEEYEETIDRLCVGAIKYGMLCSDPSKDITFDLKDWLSFDGNTGPYLMYSYARIQSIWRKAEAVGHEVSEAHLDTLDKPEEHELLRYLYDFNDVVEVAREQYKPSLIAHYLFDLAKSFNRFYTQVPVLKAENPDVRGARLALITAVAETLKVGQLLLGLKPPNRM